VTKPLRELERAEDRVLGALRFVDVATGGIIVSPLEVVALEGRATFIRNRSGLTVIESWSVLASHSASFPDAPAEPSIGSAGLLVAVSDPAGRYLEREARVALPRDPDPENRNAVDSLFRPVEVPMYRGPRASVGANWATLRITVSDADGGDALGGALLLVRRNGDVLGRGLTDGRGEALVAVPGVPMLTFGEGEDAVVVDEINATVEAVYDPAAGTRMTAGDRTRGARAPRPRVDPARLEDQLATLPSGERTITLAARMTRSLTLTLDLP
jgi:hypothetical protein